MTTDLATAGQENSSGAKHKTSVLPGSPAPKPDVHRPNSSRGHAAASASASITATHGAKLATSSTHAPKTASAAAATAPVSLGTTISRSAPSASAAQPNHAESLTQIRDVMW